jgi:hypothetical protein
MASVVLINPFEVPGLNPKARFRSYPDEESSLMDRVPSRLSSW